MTERRHMRIAIASDHAGFHLKEGVLAFLGESGYQVEDYGTDSDESVDYPDFGRRVAEAVAGGSHDRGILICGTGIGMSMTANKVPGIRAAQCEDCFTARASREHNDANILCLGSRVIGMGLALDIVEVWLASEFSGDERHRRRLGKVASIEE
jgi:ribose 5-phosphate isomerase B